MLKISGEEILKKIKHNLNYKLVVDRHEASSFDVYLATAEVIKDIISYPWRDTKDKFFSRKKFIIYLLSFEYLPEKFLGRNIGLLKLEKEFNYAFNKLGYKFEDILENDTTSRLGGESLGRFAFSFLDSASSVNENLMAYGIRYENGRLKQEIVNFNQVEKVDTWLAAGFPWEYRKNIVYDIEFKSLKVQAQAYDIPILGYEGKTVNTLRVWSIINDNLINVDAILRGSLNELYYNYISTKSIINFLYPEDSNIAGKKIRLGQEYFYATCSVKDILANAKKEKIDLLKLEKHIAIKMNESHTIMAIPVFIEEYKKTTGCSYEFAYEKANQIFNYTSYDNFTSKKKTWDIDLIKESCPKIIDTMEFLDEKLKEILKVRTFDLKESELKELYIIQDNKINFTNIALFVSNSFGAISELHHKIITDDRLNKFSSIFPRKFKLNRSGVSQRTWLYLSNKKQTDYLSELLNEDIIKNPKCLIKLEKYRDDETVLNELDNIKRKNKLEVEKYIKDNYNIKINPYSIFDMQLKDFHEHRRQFLTALYITKLYFDLKENSSIDLADRTFFFGGMASQSYLAAKYVINYINTLAYVVNSDLTIKNKLKVVFIENLTIEKVMRLIPSADINEQLSTPGIDMAGSSAIKYMFNSGLTIGSRTGLNLDIRNEIGEDNIFLFGLSREELDNQFKHNYYNPTEFIKNNEDLSKLIKKIKTSDNTLLKESFEKLYNLIVKYNDSFFVFKDFPAYARTQKLVEQRYRDKLCWNNMQLVNLAHSGKFSVDYSLDKFKEII